MTSPYSFLSLFAGCGGFDVGFTQAGFIPAAAFDIDYNAVQHYRQNIGPFAHAADLSLGVSEDHRFKGIDVVIAGPPCQGFSTAGKRCVDDERNSLLPLVGRLAARIRPKVLFVENVGGAVAGQHAQYWNHLNGDLRTSGYKTHSIICKVEDLGVAQIRKRLVLVAWRGNAEPVFLKNKAPRTNLRDALRGVSSEMNHKPRLLRQGSIAQVIASRIKPGQRLSNVRGGANSVHTWDIPEVFGFVSEKEITILELLLRLRRQSRSRDFGDADPVSTSRLEKALGTPFRRILQGLISKGYVRKSGDHIDLANTYNGKFKRLSWRNPSCTVDTRFGDPRYFLHPQFNRGFTVREAARIQSFPDNYHFFGDEKIQYRLIGNAVPPTMGMELALIARNILN